MGLSERKDCWSLFSHTRSARDDNAHCSQIKQQELVSRGLGTKLIGEMEKPI